MNQNQKLSKFDLSIIKGEKANSTPQNKVNAINRLGYQIIDIEKSKRSKNQDQMLISLSRLLIETSWDLQMLFLSHQNVKNGNWVNPEWIKENKEMKS